MSEPRYPTLADWRALALDAIDESNEYSYVRRLRGSLGDERDALLAAEDQHPPTVHVRSAWRWEVLGPLGGAMLWGIEFARDLAEREATSGAERCGGAPVVTKVWHWNCFEANNELIFTAGQHHKDHAQVLALCRRIAGALGGRVIDDGTGEDITEPTTEVE